LTQRSEVEVLVHNIGKRLRVPPQFAVCTLAVSERVNAWII